MNCETTLFKHIYVLPLIIGLILLLVPTITFAISVFMEHVTPVFPMVSETGNLPPESFVFSVFFNLAGFLSFPGMVIHYFLIHKRIEEKFSSNSTKQRFGVKLHYFENIGGLMFGSMAAVGLIIVANFEAVNTIYGHLAGAALVFISATTYVWCISILTLLMPLPHLPRLHIYRLVIAIITNAAAATLAVTVLMVGTPGEPAYTNEIAFIRNGELIKPGEPNFNTILILGFSEWLVVIMIGVFLLTLVPELKHVHLTIPKIVLVNVKEPLLRTNSTCISILPCDTLDDLDQD